VTSQVVPDWYPELLSSAPSVAPDPEELAEIRLAAMEVGSPIAAVTVDTATASAMRATGWLVIRDPEGAAVAALWTDGRVDEAEPSEPTRPSPHAAQRLRGTVVDVEGASPGPFDHLRRRPAEVDLPGSLAVIGHDPPDGVAMVCVTTSKSPVLFTVLDGPRRRPGPALADTVRAVRELAAGLQACGRAAEVIVLPAPEYGDERDEQLRRTIGAAYRAARVRQSHSTDRRALLEALDAPYTPHPGAGPPDTTPADNPDAQLAPSPLDALPEPTLAAWRRFRPPRSRRGLAIMFTGLSGSGKSTIARALVEALVEDGSRAITLLDGDVVRHLLSAGLGFSRADRDLNVRRIGFVAAEIARHGGIAVCAPIAPFAKTRREVREMVSEHGDFVLVHVATPLEECERRDRKGLYARARAGEIPEFTGISSPYEEPDDADLVIDTSSMTIAAAVEEVHDLLRHGGWVPPSASTHRG